uniref:Uncharacterized protein n=1 Tax=Cannabis sativa TaxID=3483 RepID=A0A803PZW7_CANSA
MAPKIIVFFHKLAHVHTNSRQKKEDGFLMTFSIGTHTQTDVPREMKVMKAHQTMEALKGKATKGRKKSNDKTIKRGVARASKAIAILKSLESIQTKSTKSSCIHIGTTKVKQQGLTQIMIGFVPINLVDVSFCMVNSTEENTNGLDFLVQKTTKDPTSSLCITKLLNNSTAGPTPNMLGRNWLFLENLLKKK